MNKKLTERLKDIDFIKGQNLFSIDDSPKNPYIQISLIETKKLFPEVSYIYFRQFPQKSRSPLAQAFIFNFTDEIALPEHFGETVKNIWLTGKIPLIYAFTKTEVNIISGYKQPDYKDNFYDIKNSILDHIELADLANNKIFSAKKLDNGSFWDDHNYSKFFNFKHSPYEILLRKIKDMLNNSVENDHNFNDEKKAKSFYQKLLLRSILIKYLEDRTDEDNNRIFPTGFFQKYSGNEDDFISVLSKRGAVIDLFIQLEKDFNGNIFALNDSEKAILKNKDLSHFISVFDGYVDEKHQIHIWELYSFNYIPIELISNIYEEFMPKTKGVVYTPPFLVDFLIDRSMPLKDLINIDDHFRIIDPSCGSGVFLVAAFKRLVQAWKIKHINEGVKPSIDDLKGILFNCIFGIDKQKESIELASFSLTIALCDQLSPKKIRELKFEDLTETNLLKQDFFSVILNDENTYDKLLNSFDLVIGNPPFDSKLTTLDAKKIEQKQKDIRGFKIPDNQIALLFLETAPILCKTNGRTCLIQPAGPSLYNSGSFNFRSYLFETYNIPIVYDFTPLESTLFGIAKVATTAFIIENKTPTKKSIFHIIIRRTLSSKERMFFELDKYDFHNVSYNEALENRLIWKSNLLGGGRLKFISKQLQSSQSLKEYLDKKKNENGWTFGEGFIPLSDERRERFDKLKEKKNISQKCLEEYEKLKNRYSADYLTNRPYINLKNYNCFSYNGINNDCISILNEKLFYRKAKLIRDIFSPPHLLIREIITEKGIPIEFRDDYLTFTSQVLGIHSPFEDITELKNIESHIKKNRQIIFLISLLSSRVLISKSSSLLAGDILSMPSPECKGQLNFNLFEKILIDDVLKYQIDFRRKGEKAKVMKPVKQENLDDFSKVFLQVLNSVYKDFRAAESIKTTSFICFPFYICSPEDDLDELRDNEEKLENHLKSIMDYEPSSTLRINRVLRIYHKNVIYLIKPYQLRYWLKSIAIRDADETIADFIHQGF